MARRRAVAAGLVLTGGALVAAVGTPDRPRTAAHAAGAGGAAKAILEAGRADAPSLCPGPRVDRKIAGVSFDGPRRPIGPEVMTPVLRVEPGWIAVLPFAYVDAAGRVVFERERQWWGEGAEGIRASVRAAREHGLRVMVKPHLWVARRGWAGDYAPATAEELARFEEGYRRYALRFAALADSLDAELFAVGTEVDHFARDRPEFWRDLIARVREVYAGPLTYAANWDGYRDVAFWDALDYIGVDAYFPLSETATPSVDELVAAWRPHVEEVAEACRRHGKPVLFTEFGYRSVDGSAGRQWELPSERAAEVPPNYEAQANAYEAMFRTWWGEPWFAGSFLWKWHPYDAEVALRRRTAYTPQHKPVESVIRRWYGIGEAEPGR